MTLEAWSLFFDDEILNCILIRTNEEINREIAKMMLVISLVNLITNAWKCWNNDKTIVFRGIVKNKQQNRHTKVVVVF